MLKISDSRTAVAIGTDPVNCNRYALKVVNSVITNSERLSSGRSLGRKNVDRVAAAGSTSKLRTRPPR